MAGDGAEELILGHTRVASAGLVPEFRLHLAEELVSLWQATEWLAARPQAPPFWAFAWPGSQALARFLLDRPAPGLVADKRVLDYGSGGGLAAIAAAYLGAASVVAYDVDPLAVAVQQMNARLNGVTFESRCADPARGEPGSRGEEMDAAEVGEVDVVLAGDVCYEREPAERSLTWLRALAARGVRVLLADPGRAYAPRASLELLATYDVPTLHELESAAAKRTHLWRVLADGQG